MKYIRNISQLLLLFSILCISCKSVAQTPKKAVTLTEKQLEAHKSDYAKKVKTMGMAVKPSYFYDRKVNINKADEFKAVGLDLIELGNKVGVYDYKENALISELIVLGTIVERQYHQDRSLQFHTTYKIEVQQVLKGTSGSNYVYVKTVSGSVGEDQFVNRSTEPKLYLGEEVMLMLSAVDVAGFAEAKTKGYFNKTLNATTSDYTINGKYSLKSGNLFNESKKWVGKQKEVLKTIEKIIAINDDINFYSKSFK